MWRMGGGMGRYSGPKGLIEGFGPYFPMTAHERPKRGEVREGRGGRWPVSRVLSSGPAARWTAIPLGRPLPDASSNQPGRWPGNRPAARWRQPSLFGLAPGGVYHAGPVTRPAVRSYRTLSPLPRRGGAVCFLWHFPWSRLRRTLSGTVFPWSPDFPPRAAGIPPTRRPSSHLPQAQHGGGPGLRQGA